VICEVSLQFTSWCLNAYFDFVVVCRIRWHLSYPYADFSKSSLPCDLRDCIAHPLRRYNRSVWLSTAVVEVILFVLAFSVCLRHFRELRALGQWNPRSLLGVLFHDSIFYILIALTAHVSAAFLWYLAPVSQASSRDIFPTRTLTSQLTWLGSIPSPFRPKYFHHLCFGLSTRP
jgi:hypothetical protein